MAVEQILQQPAAEVRGEAEVGVAVQRLQERPVAALVRVLDLDEEPDSHPVFRDIGTNELMAEGLVDEILAGTWRRC